MSRLVVEGTCLENRRTKVPWVQILPHPPEAGSRPDDVRVAQHLTENDNAR